MGSKFKDHSNKHLFVLITVAIVIVVLFLMGVFFIIKNRMKFKGYILLFSSLSIAGITYFVFCKTLYDVPQEINIKSNKDKQLTQKSNHCSVKIDTNKKIVEKKLKPISCNSEEDPEEALDVVNSLPTLFSKKNNEGKVTLLQMFLFSFISSYYWEGVRIREKLSQESPYFAKTYDLDDSDCSWKEEYIPLTLYEFKNLNKSSIKRQLLELDNFLMKKSLYYTDCHVDNIRLDDKGTIKIIDGEIFTNKEFKIINSVKAGATKKKLKIFNRLYSNSRNIEKYYM